MSCFSHKHQSLWLFLWVDWLLLMLYGEGVIRRFRDVRRSAGVKYVVYTRNLMVLHILDHWHSSYLSLSVICPSSKGLLYHFFFRSLLSFIYSWFVKLLFLWQSNSNSLISGLCILNQKVFSKFEIYIFVTFMLINLLSYADATV